MRQVLFGGEEIRMTGQEAGKMSTPVWILTFLIVAAAMAWSGQVDQEDGLLLLNVLLQAVSAFVTVCHGFTAGAGPTLLAAIRATATAVVEVRGKL